VTDSAKAGSPGVHRVAAAEEGGSSPAAELRRRLLGQPRIVYRGTGRRPLVALTFDDGPSRWTREIAAALEEHECRATFFLRGSAVEARPQDVVALERAGHELGNHLWSHADPTSQSGAEIRAEIDRAAAAIHTAAGRRPRLVRPPYCKAPYAVARAARRSGVRLVVQRTIGSSDWSASAPEDVLGPMLANVRAGDIVCMHDGVAPDEPPSATRDVTVAVVQQAVPALLDRGLQPVTVSRLLR
jgi:peptidoglycan-N-acetylglucosamine deacetylase